MNERDSDLRKRAAPSRESCGESHCCGHQPGAPVLRRDQVRLGDGDLLGLGIARPAHDLQPVPQRRRDALGSRPVPAVARRCGSGRRSAFQRPSNASVKWNSDSRDLEHRCHFASAASVRIPVELPLTLQPRVLPPRRPPLRTLGETGRLIVLLGERSRNSTSLQRPL